MDKGKNIGQLAADTILERGVRVKLPAPRFFRFFGKKEISLVIRQPYFGTLLHISRLCLKSGFDLNDVDEGKVEAAHHLMSKHGATISRIAAIAFLNGKVKIKLFSWLLGRWLLWKLTPRKLLDVVLLVVTLGGIQDFTSSIRLIRSMDVTRPKNLSPQDQGSQEAKQ